MPDDTQFNSQEVVERLQRELGWHHWHARRGFEANFKCEYCGRDLLATINDYDAWQLDHIVPLSKDGPDKYENTALCCKACNFMKRTYVPSEGNRAERIADAHRYIEEKRARKEVEMSKVWEIVGYRVSPS